MTFVQRAYQTPWTCSDLAYKLLQGEESGLYLAGNRYKDQWTQVLSVVNHFFQYREQTWSPLFQNHRWCIYPLYYTSGLLLAANVFVALRAENSRPSSDKKILFAIWHYTPRLLAIFNVFHSLVTLKSNPIPSVVSLVAIGGTFTVSHVYDTEKSGSMEWAEFFPLFSLIWARFPKPPLPNVTQ